MPMLTRRTLTSPTMHNPHKRLLHIPPLVLLIPHIVSLLSDFLLHYGKFGTTSTFAIGTCQFCQMSVPSFPLGITDTDDI